MSPIRFLAPLLVLIVGTLATISQAQQGSQQPDPNLREMSDEPAVVLPEQKALEAALRITTVSERLKALEKIRLGYPQSTMLNAVDSQVLSAVLQMPDAEESAAEVLNRMLSRIPANATADTRFNETVGAAARLVTRKVLLDRAEEMLKAALAPETLSSHNRASGRYQMGRLFAAKNDPMRAEAEYRAAASESPAAVASLVSFYIERNERAKAEAFLLEVIKTAPVNVAALTSLTNLYKADPAKSEAILRDAVNRDPLLPVALLQLAKLEQDRGDTAGALDHYLKAAAFSYLRGADGDAMRALYAKHRGNAEAMTPALEAKLDAEINERYKLLPKTLKGSPYTPTPKRTDRVVVIEMFTGSACPPCVAADLAFDATMDRYDMNTVIPLAYHQHIPGPDPMTTPETVVRRNYYNVNGVPTMHVSGALAANDAGENLGGGGRARAPEVYEKYVSQIDKALEVPADAALSVKGTIVGDKVTITADVTKLPGSVADLRLHLVLAEKQLLFGGENGIRGHHMVVRGVGGEKGEGIPIAAAGTVTHTFDLGTIRTAITRSLAQDIARRRGGGGGTQTFAAEDKAMTTFDLSNLVAVAFVQAPNRRILQAAQAVVTK
jgi:tetratricopeptide (TPR) repeat protein